MATAAVVPVDKVANVNSVNAIKLGTPTISTHWIILIDIDRVHVWGQLLPQQI